MHQDPSFHLVARRHREPGKLHKSTTITDRNPKKANIHIAVALDLQEGTTNTGQRVFHRDVIVTSP